jgi:hypothetical protein
MWYRIDYDRLAILMLPTFLRKPILVGFVQALLQPIASLHRDWLVKRTEDWYLLEHTGQVCRLRKVLNDNLDNVQRRITIASGSAFVQEYIWTETEAEKQWIDDTFYVYSEDEYENTGVDFVVFVPQSVIDTEPFKLDYIIKFYKLAGKRYGIEVLP